MTKLPKSPYTEFFIIFIISWLITFLIMCVFGDASVWNVALAGGIMFVIGTAYVAMVEFLIKYERKR